MKNRPSKPLKKYKIVNPNGEIIIFNGFEKMIEEFGFNRKLVRKFLNTGNKITAPRSKTKETLNTLNYIINEITNETN
jgi:hypothetical protein